MNWTIIINMRKGRQAIMMATKIWVVLILLVVILLVFLAIGTFSRPVYQEEVHKYFDRPFLNKAADYQYQGLIVSVGQKLITWALLAGGTIWAWKYFASFPRLPLLVAAGYLVVFFLVIYLASLPLDFYRGFILEHRFGLSNLSWSGWLMEFLKSRGISLVFTVFALAGLYYLMGRFMEHWWWIATLGFACLVLVGSYLFPILIDPLFYRFQPLEDPEMYRSVISMADQTGLEVEEVLVADASRKTQKVNAYFTGLGKTKRIVLYDTLLTRLSKKEALAVIAHEMAHWRFNHILKGIAFSTAGALVAFYLLNMILRETVLWGDFRAIFLALLFFSLFSFVTLPLQNTVSRHFEVQADREAIRLTGQPETHIQLKSNMARVNLADVQPHPFVRTILYTHPTVMERIQLAQEEAEK